jgi:hypothetical protein
MASCTRFRRFAWSRSASARRPAASRASRRARKIRARPRPPTEPGYQAASPGPSGSFRSLRRGTRRPIDASSIWPALLLDDRSIFRMARPIVCRVACNRLRAGIAKLIANAVFCAPPVLFLELLDCQRFANAPKLLRGSPLDTVHREHERRPHGNTEDRVSLRFVRGDRPLFSNQEFGLVPRHFEHVALSVSRHVDPVELVGELPD